jgi:hypothetical protein
MFSLSTQVHCYYCSAGTRRCRSLPCPTPHCPTRRSCGCSSGRPSAGPLSRVTGATNPFALRVDRRFPALKRQRHARQAEVGVPQARYSAGSPEGAMLSDPSHRSRERTLALRNRKQLPVQSHPIFAAQPISSRARNTAEEQQNADRYLPAREDCVRPCHQGWPASSCRQEAAGGDRGRWAQWRLRGRDSGQGRSRGRPPGAQDGQLQGDYTIKETPLRPAGRPRGLPGRGDWWGSASGSCRRGWCCSLRTASGRALASPALPLRAACRRRGGMRRLAGR